ncbi:hypothetical protein RclHR1_04000020 [Rhizophagus clarus]|uniref:Uncharacterized protein n=1 Tax=Rhizophagus clarus TaxID=94130 RepID=A0A2Z6S993_9GLOM|nr:hypothetical protein RclHR1_04000020 [Rhizophagus clarus]
MKKCFNQISQIQRLSYTAYIIQLVVRKGLLAAKTLIAHTKRLINFFTSPKQNKHLFNAQKKNSKDIEKENNLHTIFYRQMLKYINPNSKEDAKRLIKINLINSEWKIIRNLLEILGLFAKLTEKLEDIKYATISYMYPGITKLKKHFCPATEFNNNLDLETNNYVFEEHQFEEVDEDDKLKDR